MQPALQCIREGDGDAQYFLIQLRWLRMGLTGIDSHQNIGMMIWSRSVHE
jgi:hypothetical protein